MSLYPCSMCGRRSQEKFSNATWAWWDVANVRHAYRQRVCLECFATTIAPLEAATREFSLCCPACGISTDGDMDPTYLTVYVPRVGRVRLEMPTCAPCAAEVRLRGMRGAVELRDEEASSVGRGPQTEAPNDPWAALGIVPRE